MTLAQPLLFALGRTILGAFFLLAGVNKIGGFAGTAGYIASQGLPMPEVLAAATIALEVLAGIALILGFKTRIAAFLLAGFTILASILFHAYWAMPADQAYVQQLMFMKNMAIAGGLIFIWAAGAGGLAIDEE